MWSGVLASTALIFLSLIQHFGFARHTVHLLSVIPPFAATTALLYGATQAPTAQPRAVLLGFLICGLCGVSCQLMFRQAAAQPISVYLGAALAVAVTLALSKFFSVIHPPACAAAISAALLAPNQEVEDQGFLFLVTPLLLGSLVLLTVAWLGNNMVPSRPPYPTVW